ncbi:iron-containing alcohol dehydrogenase [Lachnoclostridium sp. Marseille-P6806]|uniref:iron-containing alcohol dehydrogenase n=1 Tax=Lachnoclostridium sp. Marseille-P6806 TaxID=2364793 RepID=UPI001031EC56|nr:iron-containing alcohol dehydrogenase [Lachnoclostridium sp. Marseille-P6806]
MLTKYELQMPGMVFAGENALDRIPEVLKGAKRTAVYADKGIVSAGLLEPVSMRLEKAGRDYRIFDNLATEPSYRQVQESVGEFRASGCDFIIAVGGGSVMDAAKLTSILATDEYDVKDLLNNPGIGYKQIATLMVPTTAGTGAEATPNAIVAVPEKEIKVGIVNRQMMPDYVVLDGEMVRRLPRNIAAATGIDALCHAIECWTGNKSNPFSDVFAIQALDMILSSIEKACDDQEAIHEKRMMQIASFYAGVAIAASGTTAVHALSYPLGGKYHIAHGISNAIMLMPVMRFNEEACRERLVQAYDRCVHAERECTADAEKSRYMIDWMERIVKHLDIPSDLSGFGVSRNDLDGLVKGAMEQQRLLVNNMRRVTPEDARSIYLSVL